MPWSLPPRGLSSRKPEQAELWDASSAGRAFTVRHHQVPCTPPVSTPERAARGTGTASPLPAYPSGSTACSRSISAWPCGRSGRSPNSPHRRERCVPVGGRAGRHCPGSRDDRDPKVGRDRPRCTLHGASAGERPALRHGTPRLPGAFRRSGRAARNAWTRRTRVPVACPGPGRLAGARLSGGSLVGAPLHPGDHRLLHADEGGELGLGEPLRLAHPSHRHRKLGLDHPGLVGATELRVRELILQIILCRTAPYRTGCSAHGVLLLARKPRARDKAAGWAGGVPRRSPRCPTGAGHVAEPRAEGCHRPPTRE
jgi:hypothetical protein